MQCLFSHEMMDEWRENFKGVQYLHEPTNFIITGSVDDLWQGENVELLLQIIKLQVKLHRLLPMLIGKMGIKDRWKIYQWLLRHNGLKVSNTDTLFIVMERLIEKPLTEN